MGTNRSAGARVAAVIAAVVVGGCGQAAPSGSTAGPVSTDPAPSVAASAVPSTPSEPPVRAGGMTLAGSVPGSNGDLAFVGDLAVVTNAPDWELESDDDGFIVVDVSDPANPATLGAFRCILEVFPGGRRALAKLLPAKDGRMLESGPLKAALDVPQARFEAQWANKLAKASDASAVRSASN